MPHTKHIMFFIKRVKYTAHYYTTGFKETPLTPK